MTDQVETKQVQWQDLEVKEEPRYFEGLGEEAAQIHQELCGEITEWEEGNESVPVKLKKEFKSDSLEGVLLLHGVSEEEFLVAIAQAEAHLSRILSSYPVLSTPNREMTWNVWIAEISADHIRPVVALCTASRANLTRAWRPSDDE